MTLLDRKQGPDRGVAETDPAADACLNPVLARLERVEGLAATPVLVDRMRRHLDQLPAAERRAILVRLAELPAEGDPWSSLVETLVNHETYFLRDAPQFELLARLLPNLIASAEAAGRTVLRAWSAGCATGEEAYSLALVLAKGLLQQGKAARTHQGIELLDPWRVEVVGSDLSRRALAVADAGRYAVQELSSSRQVAEADLAFFPLVPGSQGRVRQVQPRLRELVRFERRNIARAPRPPGSFDVVACRNVLIYLTASARAAATKTLSDALEPGGCLLVGPTDLALDPAILDAVWSDRAIVHRRRDATAPEANGTRGA